jgi:ADP-ribose pyrophosphatase
MNIKKKETIYEGFYTLRKLIVEDDGDTFEREQFESGDAVAALVYDTYKNKYIFVKQYRFSAEQELLEVVAGVLGDDDPELIIRKEIKEETGYKIDKLEHIWNFYTSPGACTEQVHLFYAEVSEKETEGGGLDKEHENIKIKSFTLDELRDQKLADAKTIIAVQWLLGKNHTFRRSEDVSL